MADEFATHAPGLSSPVTRGAAVTPSDDTDLTSYARALFVGTNGNVSLVTVGGDTLNFTNLAAGSILPVRARRVRATATTATGILALW